MTTTAIRTQPTTGITHVVTLQTIGSRRFRQATVWDCASDDEAREFVQANYARPREEVTIIYCPNRTRSGRSLSAQLSYVPSSVSGNCNVSMFPNVSVSSSVSCVGLFTPGKTVRSN